MSKETRQNPASPNDVSPLMLSYIVLPSAKLSSKLSNREMCKLVSMIKYKDAEVSLMFSMHYHGKYSSILANVPGTCRTQLLMILESFGAAQY